MLEVLIPKKGPLSNPKLSRYVPGAILAPPSPLYLFSVAPRLTECLCVEECLKPRADARREPGRGRASSFFFIVVALSPIHTACSCTAAYLPAQSGVILGDHLGDFERRSIRRRGGRP